jgi:hypothetical protein
LPASQFHGSRSAVSTSSTSTTVSVGALAPGDRSYRDRERERDKDRDRIDPGDRAEVDRVFAKAAAPAASFTAYDIFDDNVDEAESEKLRDTFRKVQYLSYPCSPLVYLINHITSSVGDKEAAGSSEETIQVTTKLIIQLPNAMLPPPFGLSNILVTLSEDLEELTRSYETRRTQLNNLLAFYASDTHSINSNKMNTMHAGNESEFFVRHVHKYIPYLHTYPLTYIST